MRLNKFLAQSGIASRREADRLIQEATTTVNGILQLDPAANVSENDVVKFDGKLVSGKGDTRVFILNKPKGYITTSSDPEKRKTVMDLLPQKPRIFPVGRLDRNTTGLLLLTNDGDLAQKLMLPKNRVPRLYEVEIDRILQSSEIKKLSRGIYIGKNQKGRAVIHKQQTKKKRTNVTMELRQGKNREIRRIMAVLKRKIFSLHRSEYGTLNLKGVSVGKWRTLTENEFKKLNELVS